MKNFVSYAEAVTTTVVRILELVTPEGLPPRGNSLAMIAQETACIECALKMSRIHKGVRFTWGHEEQDGRTWLHGIAIDGQYRSIGGSTERKRPVKEVVTTLADGTGHRVRSDGDAFEITLTAPPFPDWSSMRFQLDGIEICTIYKGEE